MAQQIIGVGANADDGTGDTLRTAGTKINQNFTELFARVGDSATGVSFAGLGVLFEGSLTDSFETNLLPVNPTADRSVYLPNANGTIITDSATQTLINKTLTGPVLTSPQINDSSGTHQYIIKPSELAADRVVNLPILGGDDTIVFNSTTATLSNKTLISPTLNTPSVGTSINDAGGAEVIKTPATANAVNEITVTNAASNGNPSITATGDDTNINLVLDGKGSGTVESTKVSYTSSTMTGNGTVPSTAYIIFNSTGTIAAQLLNGSVVGEIKIFTNKNSGLATLTPDNYGQGTTFALSQADGCTAIWDGSNWNLIGQYGVTVV